MEFEPTKLSGVVLIKPKVIGDSRGFFIEAYKESLFQAHGIHDRFIQDNHSKSAQNVLRGLHYQLNPAAQAKLVRCVRGAIFDVAVDIRRGSPTFGQWVGYELTEENHHMLWIPAGFAHGFMTLASDNHIIYKTTAEYAPACDRGIKFDDPAIGIEWPTLNNVILSTKDQQQPLLQDAEINFTY
jgi:dTDP-4-dehydrorhamnose 3,5-epimerase